MGGRIVIPNFKVKVAYGSHMPVLISVMSKTNGPVLELGGGWYSTSFLHWACRYKRRLLVTCDNSKQFLDYLMPFASDRHLFKLVEDWDTFDLSEPWNVVFVDQKPPFGRSTVLPKLVNADYVIVHDTEMKHYPKYGFTEEMFNLFKYRYDYHRAYPYTSVLSNKYELQDIMK
jgi:hypothetical protein